MKQISNFKKSIPDGERFLQEPLYQCSCRRANAYIGGQNPLTWEGIYQAGDGGGLAAVLYCQFRAKPPKIGVALAIGGDDREVWNGVVRQDAALP
jgi:hypothetical protein